MDTLIVIGILLVFLGVIGSIFPLLPGPILSFGAILLLFLSRGVDFVSVSTLGVFGITVLVLIIIDYVAPILGAKFFGASKRGIWGAFIGGFLGVFMFPPLGIFLGAFVGSILGEFLAGKKGLEAVRAGIGTLLGSFSVIVLQTIFSIVAFVYFFLKILS